MPRDWPSSDHYDGERFFNPGRRTGNKRFSDFLRWRFSREGRTPWPEQVLDTKPIPMPPLAEGEIGVTYIGHATLLVRLGNFAVLTDPMFSDRASPFSFAGPKRVRKPAFRLADLPKIDAVVLSHNHYDHMDRPSLRELQHRWNPPIVTGIGNGAYLARKGIANTIEQDWWESVEPLPGLRITYVPSQHWSRRSIWDTNRMLWGGHIIEVGGGRAYFAGDTGYPAQFAEIAHRLGAPDVALLPIGAYEPRWFMAPQHMNPDDAVRAHLDLGARLSIAIHFATFALTDEAIDAPAQALAKALHDHNIDAAAFRVPAFGETIIVPNKPVPASTHQG